MADDLLALACELGQRQEPFALATVVRCERPTSAKPGAKALIRADGAVTGWIGGSCAEPLVVKEALEALHDGQPRLLVLVGEGGGGLGGRAGVRAYAMTCHSGGTLEIYVEPVLPKPQLVLVGEGPVVATLAALAPSLGFAMTVVDREVSVAEDLARIAVMPESAIVVATHGRFDEDALEQALRSDASYVSLVASPRRSRAVIEALQARGVSGERLSGLKAPAGLDLGAVTPEEIAVSILAEIIRVRRSRERDTQREGGAEELVTGSEAHDPVCGMSVDIATARYSSAAAGRRVYFCCHGCKDRFDRDPAKYARGAPA